MNYLIWVYEDETSEMFMAEVPDDEQEYLRKVNRTLKPLSPDDYLAGPDLIMSTAARFTYVQDGASKYWCIEWNPGFLVVEFHPKHMKWTAIKAHNPYFGGREPSQEEIDAYDEDAWNPQYDIIFHPWDSQFESDTREGYGFTPISEDVRKSFESALKPVSRLEEIRNDEGRDGDWPNRCRKFIADFAGEGIHIETSTIEQD